MAITLRTEKGTALTYAEMDKNFSSFFYSASVDYTTDQLQLWYTGSVDLSTPGENFNPGRVINIPLNPSDNAVTALTVAGGPGEIQFRDYDNSVLAASSNFIYSSTGNLGIGTPSPSTRLHVRGSNSTPATLRLQSNNGDNLAKKSTIEFYEGTTLRGEIGRLSTGNNDIYINTAPEGNLRFKVQDDLNTGAWTTTGLGIGTNAPERKLHVVGEGFITTGLGIGVGAQNHAIYAFSDIGPATPQKSFKSFARFANFGGPNGGSVNGLNMITYRQEVGDDWISTGTRIQQLVDATYMGYVQFSGPDNLYGISIGTGNSKEDAFGVIHEPGHPDIQERLRIDQYGNVTINKPVANAKFDVNGDTIVTGSFTTTGNTTIKGTATVDFSLTTGTTAAVGTNLTVGGKATILDVPASAESNPRLLTVSQTAGSVGQIQYITGTFPLGGIVMWAGSPTAPPTGWTLCDGRAPVGGITIPDLRERFIVGAGGNNADMVTYNYDTFSINSAILPFRTGTGVGGVPVFTNISITGTFTRVNNTSAVSNRLFYNNINSGNSNPPGLLQSALYVLTGPNPQSSYFLVYHLDHKNYRLYRGSVPANSANVGSLTTYPYYSLPFGSVAILSEVAGTLTQRPNFSALIWNENNAGYAVGDKGGFNNVKLNTSETPAHFHHTPGSVFKSFTAGAGDYGNRSSTGTGTDGADNSQTAIGNLGVNYDADGAALERTIGGDFPHENRPPYYALAFIIYTGV